MEQESPGDRPMLGRSEQQRGRSPRKSGGQMSASDAAMRLQADALGITVDELREQVRAMAAFEENKRRADARYNDVGASGSENKENDGLQQYGSAIEEEIAKIKAQQTSGLQYQAKERGDDYEIVDYRIVRRGRTLQYEIRKISTTNNGDAEERRWRDATSLISDSWTARMEYFWLAIPHNLNRRRFLEHPRAALDELNEDKTCREPGPYGRHILEAEFEGHRQIIFQTRDCEVATPESLQEEGYGEEAEELGAEWDEAIAAYWRKCEIAERWCQSVEELDQETAMHEVAAIDAKDAGEEAVREIAELQAGAEKRRQGPTLWCSGPETKTEDGGKRDSVGDEDRLWPGMAALKLRLLQRDDPSWSWLMSLD